MLKSNVITAPFLRDAVLDSDIRCQRVELKSIDDLTVRLLFSGFDTLRAITFSASADFIDRIVGRWRRPICPGRYRGSMGTSGTGCVPARFC